MMKITKKVYSHIIYIYNDFSKIAHLQTLSSRGNKIVTLNLKAI